MTSTGRARCCGRWWRRGGWAKRADGGSTTTAVDAGLADLRRQVVELARDFARTRLEPQAAEWDRTKHFPRDVIAELAQLGDHVAREVLGAVPLGGLRLEAWE